MTHISETELHEKFRLPRVTYNRRHHEREGDEDTEAVLHDRVQGFGGHASSRGSVVGSGSQGTGTDCADAAQLDQGCRSREAQHTQLSEFSNANMHCFSNSLN